jgi:hypothetical protein
MFKSLKEFKRDKLFEILKDKKIFPKKYNRNLLRKQNKSKDKPLLSE